MKFRHLLLGLAVLGSVTSAAYAQTRLSQIDMATLPKAQAQGTIESVAVFNGAMPTGVTVSQSGRIFVNFPRWGDSVEYTVAEVRNGQTEAYPNPEINRPNPSDLSKSFVSVQSVVVDPRDRSVVVDPSHVRPFGHDRDS